MSRGREHGRKVMGSAGQWPPRVGHGAAARCSGRCMQVGDGTVASVSGGRGNVTEWQPVAAAAAGE